MKKHENAFILYKFFLLLTINFSNVKISILLLSCGRFYCNIIVKSRRYTSMTKKLIKVEFYMIMLKNKIKVIVPKEDNAGRKIDSKMLERSITRATDIFGGATKYDGTGYWASPGGHLMTDNVSVIEWSYSLVDLIEKDKLWHASCMVGWVVAALIIFHDQQAVSVEVDGTLYIIDGNDITNDNDYKDADEAKKLIEKIMKGEF